jgi:hypothetical protein
VTPCVCLLSSPRRTFRIYGTLSVYCLSGLCLFSVATATASLLKEDFQTDTRCATCSCRQYLFPRTIIDLVLCLHISILLSDRSLRTDSARRQCRCPRQRDALLYFTCTPRTCRLYDKLHPLLGSMSRSFSVSHLFAICGASLCSPSTPGSLTLPRFCAEYIYTAPALELGHVYFWSGRRHDQTCRSTIDSCAHYILCVVASNCVYLASSRRRLPDGDFRTLLLTIWVHDSPTVTFLVRPLS